MYKKISKLMKQHKVSAYRLAKDIGINQSTVSLWKTNRCKPNLENIVKIAKYFDVPVSYFL